jgi:hypothetical protein
VALSYAGVRLPLLTPEYRDFVETYHSLSDFRFSDLWHFDNTGIDHLPLPPKPMEDMPEVGVLHWPTGLSRCAFGHYLIDTDGLTDIRTALGSGSAGPASLVMTDGTGNSRTFSMYLLCARPLSQISDSTQQCFLMTLVDKRYWLRVRRGSITSTPVSWASLYGTLSSALGITLTPDTVNADYSVPNGRWVLQHKPLSVLVDAVANAVGHRVVANLDGTYDTVTATTASTAQETLVDALSKTAGGIIVRSDLARSVESSVNVHFTSAPGGVWSDSNYTVNTTLASLSITQYDGATGVASQARSQVGELIYTGSNAATLSTYATRAARDYYLWHLLDVDITYPGITEWDPTGTEDRIEWKYGAEKPPQTRVVRPPMQVLPAGGIIPPPTVRNQTYKPADPLYCNWVAGLETTECLRMTILSASGRCSDIDTTQEIFLTWDAGDSRWESGATDFTGTGSGGTGPVHFGKTNGQPYSTIDGEYGTYLGCDGYGGILFSFGGAVLCGASTSECDNSFTVRFTCIPCPSSSSIQQYTTLPATVTGGSTIQYTVDNPTTATLTAVQFTVDNTGGGINQLTVNAYAPDGTKYTLLTQPSGITSDTAQFVINPTTGVSAIQSLTVSNEPALGVYTPQSTFAGYSGPVYGQWTIEFVNGSTSTLTVTDLNLTFGTPSSGLTLTASTDPTSGSAPLTLDSDLTVTGTPYLYSFDWGDGSALEWSTTAVVDHTYLTDDTYELIVRVWTKSGVYEEDSYMVVVQTLPCSSYTAFSTTLTQVDADTWHNNIAEPSQYRLDDLGGGNWTLTEETGGGCIYEASGWDGGGTKTFTDNGLGMGCSATVDVSCV